MIELISQYLDGTQVVLDVEQTVIIVMKKTFVELTDIEKRRGSFTQSFTLPKTETNDIFFGLFGDPSSVGEQWTPRLDAPAWLLEDSNIILQGSLKLESTNTDNDRYIISISSVLFTLKIALGDSRLSDLDMAAWGIEPDDVPDTWDGSMFGGHMIFPVHDFGQGLGLYRKQGDPEVLTLQNIKDGGATPPGTAPTPMQLWITQPAFRLNELLRMIFSNHQLSLTGSWFDELNSEDIYVQSDNPLVGFVETVGTLQVWLMEAYIILNSPIWQIIPFKADPLDDSWSDATHHYTAPADGTYYWTIRYITVAGVPADRIAQVRIMVNAVQDSIPISITWGQGVIAHNVFVALLKGQEMWLETNITLSGTTEVGFVTGYRETYMHLTRYNRTGPGVDPSTYLNNHLQIDFLRAITQIFNLVIWTDDDGNFRIDTYPYYQDNFGTVKDWSDKVNLIRKPVVKPVNSELRNPIFIALSDADDILNKSYIESTGMPYGAYEEDVQMPFAQSPAAKIAVFAPSPTQEILSVTSAANFPEFIIAKFFPDVDSIDYTPPGLQLFYYNGMRDVDTFYTQNEPGGAITSRTQYPYFSNFRLFVINAWQVKVESPDLNFTYWSPPSDIVDAPSEQGLYNKYFRRMLRERYAEGIKILELKILLTGEDVALFSFADTIIVTLNGTPVGLQILEIKDYSPSNKRLTSVKAMITFIG